MEGWVTRREEIAAVKIVAVRWHPLESNFEFRDERMRRVQWERHRARGLLE